MYIKDRKKKRKSISKFNKWNDNTRNDWRK